MFYRAADASCRLTVRRRLALGGLITTSALAAGAFVSTPAFADVPSPTVASSYDELQNDLAGNGSVIQLDESLDSGDSTAPSATLEVHTDKTLDLAGYGVNTTHVVIDDGVTLTVIDSSATDDSRGSGGLYVSGSGDGAAAVQIGSDATFHVSGAEVFAEGNSGDAGIGGSNETNSTFIADHGANITAYGGDGAAGIGGSDTHRGITVSVGDAQITARGGDSSGGGAGAGIGGGADGDGGIVTLSRGAEVDAGQGAVSSTHTRAPSAIGAGEGASSLGSLSIGADTTLEVTNRYPLRLAGDTIENHGTIQLTRALFVPGTAVRGTGTIHNLGTVTATAEDPHGSSTVDPTTLVDSEVDFTGFNYTVALDGNGGTISGTTTSGHLLSDTASDLVGDQDSDWNVTAASDADTFYRFNTRADGSGDNIAVASRGAGLHDLAPLGLSTDGHPVEATLYAQYARIPYATATDLPDATVGHPYRATLPAAGDGLNYYENFTSTDPDHPIAGLPAGLSIDPDTGVISGTPTEPTDHDVVFYVQGIGAAELTYHLTVGGTPAFGTGTLPAGTTGNPYSTTLAVSGGPAHFELSNGTLPAGLTLNATTGAITGTPTAATSAPFTIRARNRFGTTDHTFTLTIATAPTTAAPAPTPSTPAAPVVAAVPRTTVKLGHAVTVAVTANSTLPVSYTLTRGSLPKGVALDSTSGLISGSPAESGTFIAQVTATSSAGSATTTVVLEVPPVQQLLSTTGRVPAVKISATAVPVKVKGLKKGERWTVRLDGVLVDHGRMKRAGTLSLKVHLSKAKKDTVHTIRIHSSRKITDPAETASTTFTVTSLTPKKTLKTHVRTVDGAKVVAVEKLAAGERVVVKDGRKIIAKGHASAHGIFTFPQVKAGTGSSRLTIHGATTKRAATITVHNPTA